MGGYWIIQDNDKVGRSACVVRMSVGLCRRSPQASRLWCWSACVGGVLLDAEDSAGEQVFAENTQNQFFPTRRVVRSSLARAAVPQTSYPKTTSVYPTSCSCLSPFRGGPSIVPSPDRWQHDTICPTYTLSYVVEVPPPTASSFCFASAVLCLVAGAASFPNAKVVILPPLRRSLRPAKY